MGHAHIKTIETSRSLNHYKRHDKNRTDPISTWILLQNHPKNFPKSDKKWKLSYFTRPQQSTIVKAYTS